MVNIKLAFALHVPRSFISIKYTCGREQRGFGRVADFLRELPGLCLLLMLTNFSSHSGGKLCERCVEWARGEGDPCLASFLPDPALQDCLLSSKQSPLLEQLAWRASLSEQIGKTEFPIQRRERKSFVYYCHTHRIIPEQLYAKMWDGTFYRWWKSRGTWAMSTAWSILGLLWFWRI